MALLENLTITIKGTLPDGTPSDIQAVIEADVAFILMKAMALMGRTDPKDAYDIFT